MIVKTYLLVLFFVFNTSVFVNTEENAKLLTRRKRYLAFPEGSVLAGVFCLTNLMKQPANTDIFSLNINWGLSYELPNETKPILDVFKPGMKRRNRRSVYRGVETILTSMGYDGRSCLLRSLCEAGQRFKMKEDSLIYHILSIIFRFPLEPLDKREPDSHRIYHYASSLGVNQGDLEQNPDDIHRKCSETFRCPFSLIDLTLGYYAQNPFFGLKT